MTRFAAHFSVTKHFTSEGKCRLGIEPIKKIAELTIHRIDIKYEETH